MIKEVSDLKPAERAEHERVFGKFNDFPPNWREVTEAEIATRSAGRCYSPVLREYRQMGTCVPGGEPLLPATLEYYHDGSGRALHHDYWGRRLRWFMFERCAHTYAELSMAEARAAGIYHGGRCYHVNRCTKCGYVNSYDSSD